MARESQFSGRLVDLKSSEVVGSLVARVEEVAGGREVETAWVVSPRPFFRNETQFPRFAHSEDRDAIVESISGVDEASIRGDENP